MTELLPGENDSAADALADRLAEGPPIQADPTPILPLATLDVPLGEAAGKMGR